MSTPTPDWGKAKLEQRRDSSIALAKRAAIAVVVAALAYFIGYPLYKQFVGKNQAAIAVSNLSQMGKAVMIYATENDDRLPPVDYMAGLKSQLHEESTMKCPITGEPFKLNPKVASLQLSEIGNKETLVIFYAGSHDTPDFRYDRYSAVGFLDGKSKRIEAGDTLDWEPKPVPR